MESIRAFIAFDTPEKIRSEMVVLQQRLKNSMADVRWESPDKFHATIKFLGDVEQANLSDVLRDIASVTRTHEPFAMTYQGLGTFPDIRHPRVVWIGCENPDGHLEELKLSLDRVLATRGFEIERRPFRPHITLGRVKSMHGIKNLTPMLENLTFEPRATVVDRIIVMKSLLLPQGAEYTIIETLHLQSQ